MILSVFNDLGMRLKGIADINIMFVRRQHSQNRGLSLVNYIWIPLFHNFSGGNRHPICLGLSVQWPDIPPKHIMKAFERSVRVTQKISLICLYSTIIFQCPFLHITGSSSGTLNRCELLGLVLLLIGFHIDYKVHNS